MLSLRYFAEHCWVCMAAYALKHSHVWCASTARRWGCIGRYYYHSTSTGCDTTNTLHPKLMMRAKRVRSPPELGSRSFTWLHRGPRRGISRNQKPHGPGHDSLGLAEPRPFFGASGGFE